MLCQIFVLALCQIFVVSSNVICYPESVCRAWQNSGGEHGEYTQCTNGIATEHTFDNTQCSGNSSSRMNVSYIDCDSVSNCSQYIHFRYYFNDCERADDSSYVETIESIGCNSGGIKRTCTDSSYIQETYESSDCSGSPTKTISHENGCHTGLSGGSVYWEIIYCGSTNSYLTIINTFLV
eukprot:258108_1